MFDPARLVFIDETCTNTSMVRLRGRCPRGERLIGYAPHGHWKTITFVAGLRHRAMVAPFVLEGAMNGPLFLAYVRVSRDRERRFQSIVSRYFVGS
ncbi:MAG: transposase [Pseudolabrys sp.]